VPLAPRRMDGDGVKFKAICGGFCCSTTFGELFASLRTAAGNSCSPQLCTAARRVAGPSWFAVADSWQASLSAAQDDPGQMCEWQKGAHSGIVNIATSVNSAVICRPFIVMVNATPRSAQSQIIRAKRFLARWRLGMRLILGDHNLAGKRAVNVGKVSGG
jgi:hypothetical protein